MMGGRQGRSTTTHHPVLPSLRIRPCTTPPLLCVQPCRPPPTSDTHQPSHMSHTHPSTHHEHTDGHVPHTLSHTPHTLPTHPPSHTPHPATHDTHPATCHMHIHPATCHPPTHKPYSSATYPLTPLCAPPPTASECFWCRWGGGMATGCCKGSGHERHVPPCSHMLQLVSTACVSQPPPLGAACSYAPRPRLQPVGALVAWAGGGRGMVHGHRVPCREWV